MQTQIRPWMLAYTIIFGLLSVRFIFTEFQNEYHLVYIILEIICCGLILGGNLIYSFDFANPTIRKIWKYVFPIVVLEFVSSGIVDSIYGKYGQKADAKLLSAIVVWVIYFAFYFPTFYAHYKISYGKEADNDAA
jgi:hypothetical protein